MEMNTRLQVEHPVTEAITGLDLVEWQLAIARGGKLPLRQQDLSVNGHAVEVRLYAEDPDQDFLPQFGQLASVVLPDGEVDVRVDSGITGGDIVSVYYDPMLAKIIAHGNDRPSALSLMQRALSGTYIGGLATNIDFLERIIRHDEFSSGAPDTGFIDRNRKQLVSVQGKPSHNLIYLAVVGLVYHREAQAKSSVAELFSPWLSRRGWRLNAPAHEDISLRTTTENFDVSIHHEANGMTVSLFDGSSAEIAGSMEGHRLTVLIRNMSIKASWFMAGKQITVLSAGERYRFYLADDKDDSGEDEFVSDGLILSPMPGRVSAVLVEVGQTVEAGQHLVVVEAMKMEHSLKSPSRARVTELRCRVGDQVEERLELVVLTALD